MTIKTKEGTFVYKALTAIGVRSNSTTDESHQTELSVREKNLVSIDYVQEVDNEQEFLRLSDGSGWLFNKKQESGEIFMERVPVKSGFWTFYVDNPSVGIQLRNHPIDQISTTNLKLDHGGKMVFQPMQKVCNDHPNGA